MKISILLRTQDYRGDHCADVAIAVEPVENETVRELAQRLLPDNRTGSIEVIEIRRVAMPNEDLKNAR